MDNAKNNQKLPEIFKPLFWSYDFNSLDLIKNKKTIILATINFGDLNHWRWLKAHYGTPAMAQILEDVSATEFKKRAGKLAELLFEVKLNHAPRGTH